MTTKDLAAFAASGDSAFQSNTAELKHLASDTLFSSTDLLLTNKLLKEWTTLYGNRNDWPTTLNDSYETIVANVGLASFANALSCAMQNIRVAPETLPAFQAAVDVVAPFMGPNSPGLNFIPDSAAAAGLSFVKDPLNIILPIYGGAFAGRIGGAIVARFGASLGLATEALASLGSASSLAAESAGFMGTGHVIASLKGEAIPNTLTEFGATTLFFGILRTLDRGTNVLASLVATGETGLAAARLIGHAGAVTSLAVTEHVWDPVVAPFMGQDISPMNRATTFSDRMWNSLFLYATLSATRGVIGEVTGQPNAAHRISAEALEMFRSMQRALTQPEPAGVIARSVSDEAISPDHSISGDPRVRGDDMRVNSAQMLAATEVRGSEPVLRPPPPPPPPVIKECGIYVIQVAGHGLEPDYAKMDNEAAVKGTTSATHIVMRGVGKDGRLTNRYAQTTDLEHDGLFDEYASGPEASRHLDKNILDLDALATFLVEAAEKFPAEKIIVSFEGHSGDLRKFIPEIHAALVQLKAKLGRNIDVLIFDSCFMSQIEIATEFSDVANYMDASQEGVVTFRSFPRISQQLSKTGATDPRQLAYDIAHNNKEFTFSAIDLKQVAAFNQAMKELGQAILSVQDFKAFRAIRKAMRDATGYYTEGFFSHNHFSNTVDLKGFIMGIEKNPYLRRNFRAVTDAAARAVEAFGKKGEKVIVEERHAKKLDKYYLDITDVRGSHGLSIHQRITPKWLWNAYTHLKNSAFNKATGWDKVTDHITQGNIIYQAASVLHFVGGLATAGVNNGLQRVVEIWNTYWFKRKMMNATN